MQRLGAFVGQRFGTVYRRHPPVLPGRRQQVAPFSNLLHLIQGNEVIDGEQAVQTTDLDDKQQAEAFLHSPLFTPATNKATKLLRPQEDSVTSLISQYGLVGMLQDDAVSDVAPEDRLVLANLNVPWSAFICGSQGAGKSHTVSCFLENALAAHQGSGELSHPLAGLVMHYDHYSNFNSTQLCEAAYLCSAGIPVNVLVSPSNIWAMRRLYANLPGLPPDAPRPKVLPLYLEDKQLDISRILKLMAVDPNSQKTPLYMEVIMDIARTMAMEGPGFTYSQFRERIDGTRWMKGQEDPLNLRLQLLDTFMKPSRRTATSKPAAAEEDIWNFPPGSLTIVDLSDPFISSDDACTLFSIALSIFLEERNKCGRIVVLDEAHKRHTGTRVVIATQEPTLSPELIDLANVTVVHRFLSPSWYEVLRKHLAGVKKQDKGDRTELFESIVRLRTGEAFLFCPTAQLQVEGDAADGRQKVTPLGDDYVKFKVRKRLTTDGGKSILATDTSAEAVVEPEDIDDIPMYTVGRPRNSLNLSLDDYDGPNLDYEYGGDNNDNNHRARKTMEPRLSSSDRKAFKKKRQEAAKLAKAKREEVIATGMEVAGDIIEEVKAQARLRFETQGWKLWQSVPHDKKQKVYEDAEAALQLEPGTITEDVGLRDLVLPKVLTEYFKALRRGLKVESMSAAREKNGVVPEQENIEQEEDAIEKEEDTTAQGQEQDTAAQEQDSATQDQEQEQDSTAQEHDSLPQEQDQEQDSTAQEHVSLPQEKEQDPTAQEDQDPTAPKPEPSTPPNEQKI